VFFAACAMIFAFCASNSHVRRNTAGSYFQSLYPHEMLTMMCRVSSIATLMVATPPGALHNRLYSLSHVRQPQAATTITMLTIFPRSYIHHASFADYTLLLLRKAQVWLLIIHRASPNGPSEYVIVTISATSIQSYRDTIVTDPLWTGSGSETMGNNKLYVYESLELSINQPDAYSVSISELANMIREEMLRSKMPLISIALM
jgi:hypothetical protein